jgi:hypothetical protein
MGVSGYYVVELETSIIGWVRKGSRRRQGAKDSPIKPVPALARDREGAIGECGDGAGHNYGVRHFERI